MKKFNSNKKYQSGLTVVELMVGLVLSLLLVGGVVQVYFGTKTAYNVTEGLSRLQENSRTSLDMIAKDIRMAGYIPCSQPQTTTNVVNETKWWATPFATSLQGFEGGVDAFPTEISTEAAQAPGSDALFILRGGDSVAGVNVFDATNNQFIMQRDLGAGWVENGSLMIACDPTRATFFQAGNIQNNVVTRVNIATGTEGPGNTTTNLGAAYGNDAQLANYKAVIYYVTDSSFGSGSSLYRRYLNVNSTQQNILEPEEIVEGVESMQILYGVDDSGDGVANQYLKANIVTTGNNWPNVVTVRIGFLFASDDGLRSTPGEDNSVYRVLDASVGTTGPGPKHAEDKRKRYVSSMTVSRRNI